MIDPDIDKQLVELAKAAWHTALWALVIIALVPLAALLF